MHYQIIITLQSCCRVTTCLEMSSSGPTTIRCYTLQCMLHKCMYSGKIWKEKLGGGGGGKLIQTKHTHSQELASQVVQVLGGQATPSTGMEETVQSFRETWPLNTVWNLKRFSILHGREERERERENKKS